VCTRLRNLCLFARSKSTLGVAFLALGGFPPFEVCKKGLVFALYNFWLTFVLSKSAYLAGVEIIQGLKHGFKLQYNGPRLPVQSKNSRSVSKNPDLVREKIFKEIYLGRVAGPFDYPPMPTFREKPSWSKSDGETLSNRNALLMSVFANFPLYLFC
jgi:hypothetical protein